MSAAPTSQIGLNDFARVIPGQFTFAANLESFRSNRHQVMVYLHKEFLHWYKL